LGTVSSHWRRWFGSAGFLGQYVKVVVPYWNAERKWHTRALAAGFVASDIALVLIVVGLNFWNRRLFNALQARSFGEFYALLGIFTVLLLANLAANVLHLRVQRRLTIEWREWLTRRMMAAWMASGREYQLGFLIGEHDNPDGRIAEDVRVTCEDALALTHSLLYNLLQLVSFINILWVLSGVLTLQLGGMTISIPGHMVWIALIYALTGSALATWVGRPLVAATNRRQMREADFRFGLVRARENAEAIALIRGENGERHRLQALFADVMSAWGQQTSGLARILMFTTANSMLATAFPLMIASPRYIMALISLGVLMQTAQAFQLVVSALSWPVDNLAQLAEWRASAGRVLTLHADLTQLGLIGADSARERITVERAAQKELELDALSIGDPHGPTTMVPVTAKIRPGDHVVVSGEPELIECLPRVLAHLWPWGSGRVVLPTHAAIFFMPERPYLPISTLLDAIRFTTSPEDRASARSAVLEALHLVGLDSLGKRLDEVAVWDQTLTRAEIQLLGFAQLLVQRPNWIVVEGAMSALVPEQRHEMLMLVKERFAGAAAIFIGNVAPGIDKFCGTSLEFRRATDSASRRETADAAALTSPALPETA
jgi:putative ATP-binding cassette transporter